RTSADGRELELAIRTENDEIAYGPELLPDGDTVLFTLGRLNASPDGYSRWDEAKIVTQSLKSRQPKSAVAGRRRRPLCANRPPNIRAGERLVCSPFRSKKT